MANEAKCMWFPDGFSDGNKVNYVHLDERKAYRRMIGYKTLQPKDGKERFRAWHFGVQGKVVRWPALAMAVKSHVVFSEGGELYESKTRQHKARRGQCKMWHNDTWLDRMLAAMAFLADPDCRLYITVPLGLNVDYTIQTAPMRFESPVSYDLPGEIDAPTATDEEERNDREADEEEDDDDDDIMEGEV